MNPTTPAVLLPAPCREVKPAPAPRLRLEKCLQEAEAHLAALRQQQAENPTVVIQPLCTESA